MTLIKGFGDSAAGPRRRWKTALTCDNRTPEITRKLAHWLAGQLRTASRRETHCQLLPNRRAPKGARASQGIWQPGSQFMQYPYWINRNTMRPCPCGPRSSPSSAGAPRECLPAVHLLRASPRSMRIVIIEPRAELGEGIAYSTPDLGHLLNVRAGCLSALPDESDHFTDWARRHCVACDQSFLPRTWYAEYLRSLLGPIEHIRARAVRVTPHSVGVRVELLRRKVSQRRPRRLALGSSPTVWPDGLGKRAPLDRRSLGPRHLDHTSPRRARVVGWDGPHRGRYQPEPSSRRTFPDPRHLPTRVAPPRPPEGILRTARRCPTAPAVGALSACVGSDKGRRGGRLASGR